jgi:hypothetical protein
MENVNQSKVIRHWSGDDLGIFASTLCLIHCLALPGLLALLPAILPDNSSSLFHVLMLVLIIPTTLYALWQGSRKHKIVYQSILAGIGLSFLVAEVLLHELHLSSSHWLAPFGGVMLISAHILNIRACRHNHRECCSG